MRNIIVVKINPMRKSIKNRIFKMLSVTRLKISENRNKIIVTDTDAVYVGFEKSERGYV